MDIPLADNGRHVAEIHKIAPGWLIFRDGCPGVREQVGARIARSRAANGDVALFSHGTYCALGRWIGLTAGSVQHFLRYTGTLSVLGYYRERSAVRIID